MKMTKENKFHKTNPKQTKRKREKENGDCGKENGDCEKENGDCGKENGDCGIENGN